MRAHDILGLTVFANAEQVENAYREKMSTLSASSFEEQYPAAYKRKAEELAKAREECLEYISSSFLSKTKREIQNSFDTSVSSNMYRASSTCCWWNCCCEGDSCCDVDGEKCCGCDCSNKDGDCCSNLCEGVLSACGGLVIIAVAIGGCAAFIRCANKKSDENIRNRQIEEQNRQREMAARETARYNELNGNLNDVTQGLKSAQVDLDAANATLTDFESKLKIINEFLSRNGEGIYYQKTDAYKEVIDKETECREKVDNLTYAINQINEEIEEINRHRARNNNNM